MAIHRLADNDVTEPNIGFAWHSTSDSHHQPESNSRKRALHLHRDCRGGVGSHLTCGQSRKDNVVAPYAP